MTFISVCISFSLGLVTRHSLVRAKGEVFVLLYVFFVRSTISRQPAGRFMPKFARRRTLVPDVSSPLLGVGGARRAEKRANEIFVTMGVNGEFLHFVRSTISQQPAGRFTPNFACWRSLGRDVSSPLLGVGGPRRAEKGANEIFVTMGVNGEFLHFGGF